LIRAVILLQSTAPRGGDLEMAIAPPRREPARLSARFEDGAISDPSGRVTKLLAKLD
jgi:hypothetical protein